MIQTLLTLAILLGANNSYAQNTINLDYECPTEQTCAQTNQLDFNEQTILYSYKDESIAVTLKTTTTGNFIDVTVDINNQQNVFIIDCVDYYRDFLEYISQAKDTLKSNRNGKIVIATVGYAGFASGVQCLTASGVAIATVWPSIVVAGPTAIYCGIAGLISGGVGMVFSTWASHDQLKIHTLNNIEETNRRILTEEFEVLEPIVLTRANFRNLKTTLINFFE